MAKTESGLVTRRHSADLDEYLERNRRQPGSGNGSFAADRYHQAVSHMPISTCAVLDMGCNTGIGGQVMRKLLSPECRLVGLDCVPERLAEAGEHYNSTVEALASSVPLPDASICAIVAGELIEHLAEVDVAAFIKEAARLLRPGGRLILTTPNPHYIRLLLTGRSVLDDPAHLTQFTSASLRCLVGKLGLSHVLTEGTGRVSRILGTRWPLMFVYGSYMLVAERPK